jgi:fucose permease
MFYRNLDTKDIICWFITFCIWFFYVCSCSNNGEFPFLPYRFIYSRTWFSIQQIVANPLAIKMGSDTGAHRLTLARNQLFGTTIGAILLGIALFGMGNDKTDLSLEDIKLPFIILGIAFIVVAILYEFSKIENPAKIEKQLLLKVVIHLEFWTTHNYI